MSLVPVEFLGQARAWRIAATTDHERTIATMQRLAVTLRGQRRLGQTPSPNAFTRVATSWRAQVPEAGRLSIAVKTTPKSLTITELRVMPSSFRFLGWAHDDAETTIVLTRTELIVSPEKFSFDVSPIAAVPLHAMARRFQRSLDNSEAAIRADLITLATTPEHVFTTGGDFSVPVAEGKFVGVVTEIDHQGTPWLLLVVRTFRDAGMGVRNSRQFETMETT